MSNLFTAMTKEELKSWYDKGPAAVSSKHLTSFDPSMWEIPTPKPPMEQHLHSQRNRFDSMEEFQDVAPTTAALYLELQKIEIYEKTKELIHAKR